MTKTQVRDQLLKLPIDEQLELIEEVWESLEEVRSHVEVTSAQRERLEERLAVYRADPRDVVTWDEILGRVTLAP